MRTHGNLCVLIVSVFVGAGAFMCVLVRIHYTFIWGMGKWVIKWINCGNGRLGGEWGYKQFGY